MMLVIWDVWLCFFGILGLMILLVFSEFVTIFAFETCYKFFEFDDVSVFGRLRLTDVFGFDNFFWFFLSLRFGYCFGWFETLTGFCYC